MQAEQKALLFDLIDVLRDSWWTMVAGITVGAALGLLTLHSMPKSYVATARIAVRPQTIPKELLRTTVAEDTAVRMILEERLLAGDVIEQVVERAYPGIGEEARAGLIGSVGGRIAVVPAPLIQEGFLAFDLSVTDGDPEAAAAVANVVADLCVERTSAIRSGQAQDTAGALEAQSAKAKEEFDRVDQNLADFQARHNFETEPYRAANLTQLDRMQRDLEANERNRESTSDRLQDSREELERLRLAAPAGQRVERLRAELSELLAHYSEAHPAVVRKQRELEEAETATPGAAPASEAETRERVRIAEYEAALADFAATGDNLRRGIAEVQGRLERTPRLHAQLSVLLNEHEVLKKKYLDLESKAEQARQSFFMEDSRRGEVVEVVKRATVPGSPASPQPMKILPTAIVVGLLLFVGPLLGRRVLDPLISSESALRAVADVPVLVRIPRIMTPRYRGETVRRLVRNLGVSVLFTAGLLVLIVVLR